MMEFFKKGSIVPRRLGIVVATKKAAQHWIVFGTDVVFDGKSLTSARPLGSDESLIKVRQAYPMGLTAKGRLSAPRKNRTRQQSGFSMGLLWTCSSYRDSETGTYIARFEKKELSE